MSTPDHGTPGPDELRRALRRDADGAPPASIDLDAVVARAGAARRRRRSALVGGAAGALVVVAAGGVALTAWLAPHAPSTTAEAPASSAANEAAEATDASAARGGVAPADQAPFSSDLAFAPLDRLNQCGTEPAAASPVAADGLVLRVDPPAGIDPGGRATVVVTLTNTGDEAYSGELVAGPALTIAEDVTVWHSSDLEVVETPIELAPGASTSFEAELVAERCEAADESAPALPDGLPPLAPGDYRLSAAVSLVAHLGDDALLGAPLISPQAVLVVR